MEDHGALEYLRKFITDVSLLNTFLEIFEAEPDDDYSLEGLQTEVAESLAECGLRLYLESFEPSVLRDVCTLLHLGNPTTSSKQNLAKAIIDGEEPAPQKRRDLQHDVPSKKKPLEKGVTYWEVFHHYSLEELKSFCEKNGLPRSGSCRKVIKGILTFLEREKENKKESNNKGKGKEVQRKRKRPGEENGQHTEEDKEEAEIPRRSNKNRVEPPEEISQHKEEDEEEDEEEEEKEREEEEKEVEEGEEEKEEEEEQYKKEEDSEDIDQPEGEEELALDLDALDEYPLAILRDYCHDEGIETLFRLECMYCLPPR